MFYDGQIQSQAWASNILLYNENDAEIYTVCVTLETIACHNITVLKHAIDSNICLKPGETPLYCLSAIPGTCARAA